MLNDVTPEQKIVHAAQGLVTATRHQTLVDVAAHCLDELGEPHDLPASWIPDEELNATAAEHRAFLLSLADEEETPPEPEALTRAVALRSRH